MKSNIFVSATFLLGTTTACSALQHATSDDCTRCGAAFESYNVTLSDVEDAVYGRRTVEPNDDDLFKNHFILMTARLQHMQKYLDQRDSQKIK